MALLGDVVEHVIPNKGLYLKDHRDTRNYYTHLDSDGKTNVLHGEDLVANCDATYLLLYASICRLMGIGPSEFLSILESAWFGSNMVYRARKRYSEE